MNRARDRIRPDQMETAFALALLQLSLLTAINEFAFINFLRANRLELQAEFEASEEPDCCEVEWTFGIWARLKFRESVSA